MNHSKTGSRSVKNLKKHKERCVASTNASKTREASGLKDVQGKGWARRSQNCSGRKHKA